MTQERRYGDDEVREIFDRAAGAQEARQAGPPPGSGLTLRELQEIGQEVGLDPARVADAASRLDQPATVPMRRTSLGLPISVGRTVELPRPLTDAEWEVLVGEIRETFSARGKVSAHGNLREWTNGNLHVYLERTETGPRLRMRTVKGSAVAATRMGGLALAMSSVLFVVYALGLGADDFALPVMLAILGAVGVGSSVVSLPPWAREREHQMEHIAARALALTAGEPVGDPGGER